MPTNPMPTSCDCGDHVTPWVRTVISDPTGWFADPSNTPSLESMLPVEAISMPAWAFEELTDGLCPDCATPLAWAMVVSDWVTVWSVCPACRRAWSWGNGYYFLEMAG